MFKILKKKINQYRQTRCDERQYSYFLKYGTNVALQDNINNMPRPTKSLLRILGNGDSLKSVINMMDDNCDYMVMNAHVLHSSYSQIRPRYYVLADPNFFHPTLTYDGTGIVRQIFENTTWSMTLFIPWEHTRDINLKSTEYVHVKQVNEANYVGPEQYRQNLYEHNLAMPNVNNVLASAIYLAIYLGYAEVELFGVEHSWLKDVYVNENNDVCLRDSHFYDKENVQDMVFIFGNGKKQKYHEVLKMYMDYFPAYWELRDLADRHGCHVVNMTPNSFIDAFERKK